MMSQQRHVKRNKLSNSDKITAEVTLNTMGQPEKQVTFRLYRFAPLVATLGPAC